MSVVADEQSPIGVDANSLELFNFSHQSDRIEDNPVADNARYVPVEDSRGDKMKDEFLFSFAVFGRDDNGMSGVRASLITSDDVDILAQMVDDFAFPFIAPLGADDNLNRHESNHGEIITE